MYMNYNIKIVFQSSRNFSNGKITILNPVSDTPLVLFESPVAKKIISVAIGNF